jgi:hypothetical protein
MGVVEFSEKGLMSTNPTSQSPTVSPHQQFPPALKRKKILESGLKNEAGGEKGAEGEGMG